MVAAAYETRIGWVYQRRICFSIPGTWETVKVITGSRVAAGSASPTCRAVATAVPVAVTSVHLNPLDPLPLHTDDREPK